VGGDDGGGGDEEERQGAPRGIRAETNRGGKEGRELVLPPSGGSISLLPVKKGEIK